MSIKERKVFISKEVLTQTEKTNENIEPNECNEKLYRVLQECNCGKILCCLSALDTKNGNM